MPHVPGDLFIPPTGDRGPGTPFALVSRGLPRATAVVDYIDLADVIQGHTKWVRIPPGKSLVSATIEVTEGKVWTSGTLVDMQWALIPTDIDHGFAVTYDPVVQFTSTKTSISGIASLARGWVRLKTTTATSGDDPAAKVIIDFF